MVFSAPPLSPAFPRVLLTMLICTASLALGAAVTQLPLDEVEALRDIAKSLGKTDWNFSKDPCGVDGGWGIKNNTDNSVNCSDPTISGDATVRHVISISLKRQGLPGTLPPQLARLPYLQNFDLSLNYINGTIPPDWGAQPSLVNISVYGNRLTGPIPKELGNIATLKNLVLVMNQFSGRLPLELGDLSRLEGLHLRSNNFTGELPATFAKLRALKQLILDDNQFQGKIPYFIQDFTHLEMLTIQASGLQGPIPSGIGLLTNLSDLRITDLNQTESPIPQLNRTQIKYLILRNCNLTGALPESLSTMANLKRLDLSFNKLSGMIPNNSNFSNLVDQLIYLFLTGNQLTGVLPNFMLKPKKHIDLSYNNLTTGDLPCQQQNVNLFASSSEVDNATLYSTTSGLVACLNGLNCPQSSKNVFINCGGNKIITKDATYEADTSSADDASQSREFSNWAYSSTGIFFDAGSNYNNYTASNNSALFMDNVELYTNARLSPLSLTYYGFCLYNGNYDVSLHFAEIMFTDEKNYSSLGRRLFDVYIQITFWLAICWFPTIEYRI